MDPKRLTAVVVSAVLGVILLVTVVAPIVSDGQTTTGDPITKSNQVYNSYYREVADGDTIELDGTKYVINDETITQSYRQAIFSDTFVLQLNTPSSAAIAYLIGQGDASPTNLLNTNSYTATIENNTITVVDGDSTEVYSKEFGWAYVLTAAEESASWGTISRIGTDTPYILNDNQLILSGYYYTGDNDTFYSYRAGELYTGSYEGAIEITKTIANGTTDIYQVTGEEVTVGDETFTPYLTLVPISVTGHATSGSLYSMLGVIPIVVAIGIVLGIVSMAIVNRYD